MATAVVFLSTVISSLDIIHDAADDDDASEDKSVVTMKLMSR